jgi:hypothetical protein
MTFDEGLNEFDGAPPTQPEAKSALTELRLRLKGAGFSPIPVSGKKALARGWQTLHNVSAEAVALWEKSYHFCTNTGVLTERNPAADIDIKNPLAADAVEELAQAQLGWGEKAPTRFGKAPKRALLFRTDTPFGKLRVDFESPRDPDDPNKKQGIEILCDKNQLVVAGIHPETMQPYRWHGGEPGVEVNQADLPCITYEDALAFLKEARDLLMRDFGFQGPTLTGERHAGNGVDHGARNGAERCTPEADIKRVRAALKIIPNNDLHHSDWIRIGMATWAASNGSTEGFVAWDAWSRKSGKYQAAETSRAWASFHKRPPHSIGAGSIFALANETGENWEPFFGVDAPAPNEAQSAAEEEAGQGEEVPPMVATPFAWIPPETIPRRDWLYSTVLCRKYVSTDIAAGGIGKTSHSIVEALAMVSGLPLLGVAPPRELKVWLWNLEDPREEIERRIMAAAKHYRLAPEDVEGRLFVNHGRETPLVIAETLRTGTAILHPVVDNLVREIIGRGIDVLTIDPFVSCHKVTENDNNAIDLVAKEWGRVADRGNCAVRLSHHTRKGELEVTAESGRGASALIGAARVVRVFNRMTKEEGERAGIAEENRRRYYRTYNDKQNMAPPSERSEWFQLTSVELGNGALGLAGDSVGVSTPWQWPDPTAGLTDADFIKAASGIREGSWRESRQSPYWVGHAIGQALGIETDKRAPKGGEGRAKVAAIIRLWIKDEKLLVVEREDSARRLRRWVEVADEG